jgi:hypothetical protein
LSGKILNSNDRKTKKNGETERSPRHQQLHTDLLLNQRPSIAMKNKLPKKLCALA